MLKHRMWVLHIHVLHISSKKLEFIYNIIVTGPRLCWSVCCEQEVRVWRCWTWSHGWCRQYSQCCNARVAWCTEDLAWTILIRRMAAFFKYGEAILLRCYEVSPSFVKCIPISIRASLIRMYLYSEVVNYSAWAQMLEWVSIDIDLISSDFQNVNVMRLIKLKMYTKSESFIPNLEQLKIEHNRLLGSLSFLPEL